MSGVVSKGLQRLVVFARLHVYRLVYALALFGVPLAVVYGTGGLHTIGFWAAAVLWLPVSLIGLMPFAFFILFALLPVFWLVDKLIGGRLEENLERFMPVVLAVVALVVYVRGADLGYTGDVWLPTPWPNVGALLVMATASAVFAGLIWLGGTLEVPGSTAAYPGRWHDVAEPDDEFWSDEMVEGWRAWTWENGRLRGVMATWKSEDFEAKCRECARVPGWDHSCGIYAVKDRRGVPRFYQGPEIVGRVEMWGSVIEHEYGYRAENARITDLWVASDSLAREIERTYSVPLHVGAPTLERKEAPWRT